MTRSELVKRVAEKYPHLYMTDVERLVSTVLNVMKQALADGRKIELRSFGVFGLKQHLSRMARNPVTGEKVLVPDKAALYFRPGKELKVLLNKS